MGIKIGGIYKSIGRSLVSGNNYLNYGEKYEFKVVADGSPGNLTNGGYWLVQVKQPKSRSWISGGYVYGSELKGSSYTKADITKEIGELEIEIKSLKNKLKFMEETGSAEYSEDTFKVYTALTTIENNKLSKIEKADVIAKLING